MVAQAAAPQTAGQKLRRIIDAVGTGLSAGSQTPQRKSGLADILAGAGAEFGAESQKMSTEE